MLRLTVQVPEGRDRTAVAELRDGLKTVVSGTAAASSTPAIAAAHGNSVCDPLRPWGHPPFGVYRLLSHLAATVAEAREYGSPVLLFEPQSGAALDAESFGRLALLVYGGPAGRDGRLRRTQGGVRVTDAMLRIVAARLAAGAELELRLEPLRAPRWWQFWRSRADTEELSQSVLAPLSPPLDEASVLARLTTAAPRRVQRAFDDADSIDRDRSQDGSSSQTGSGSDPFQGGGGRSGGAGASGSWGADSAPRGVDQAGRIVVGAAALAAVADAASRGAGELPGQDRLASERSDPGTTAASDAGPSAETNTAY